MENPNQAYHAYINKNREVFNKQFPLKTIKMTKKYTKRDGSVHTPVADTLF